jgi:phosphate transport system permease protein
LIVLAIAVVGYVVGRGRRLWRAQAATDKAAFASRYYGSNVAMNGGSCLPADGLLAAGAAPYRQQQYFGMIPDSAIPEGSSLGLVMAECAVQPMAWTTRWPPG